MLLSPLLRKIMTVLLVLPAGVIATSSNADCRSPVPETGLTHAGRSVVVGTAPDRAPVESHAAATRGGERLSHRDFYGDEAATAIIDNSADR